MKTIITNVHLILEEGILYDGALTMEDGVITGFCPAKQLQLQEDAVIVNGGGKYLAPGFVDIHCHGGGGSSFGTDPAPAAKHFLAHGETTILATIGHTLAYEPMKAAICRIRQLMQTEAGKNLGGIYMEGPFMNVKYGGDPRNNHWVGPIDMEKAMDIVETLGEDLRVWAVAPEREGVPEFVKAVHARKADTVFACGHSEATPAQIFPLKKYGMKLQTHSTNATGTQPSAAGTRNCGPDEACLYDPEIYAEVICDSEAIHVHPDMLRLILKIKGEDRVILITDSTTHEKETAASLASEDLNFDEDGLLYGSKLTMDVACRNMMRHTTAGLCQVFKMASLNPARAVGLDDSVGSIAVGKRANLVLCDDLVHISAVLLDGQVVSGSF